MKKLNSFMHFDIDAFLEGKSLLANSLSEWVDFDTKAHKGTKVEVVIVEDRTKYQVKDGEYVTNRFEKLSVKVRRDGLSIKPNDLVRLVNPTATVYGEYRNLLSITCDDVVAVKPSKGGE